MISPPSREELRARALPPFRPGRNWTKADIVLWESSGGRLAVKDYAGRPVWFRMTLGRYLLDRECAAYRRLQGIPGIPRFAGRIDAWAFATDFVEGTDLSRLRRGAVPARFFQKLMELLEAMHRAGVAQGDLHHRDVILGISGEPSLVDFSTAAFRPPASRGLRYLLFQAACESDRRAALKLKKRHAPDDLSEGEKRFLEHPPAWYRLGRKARRLIPGRRGTRRPPGEN